MDIQKTAAQFAIEKLVNDHPDIDKTDFDITTQMVAIAQRTDKSGPDKKAMVLRGLEAFGIKLAGFLGALVIELAKDWVMEELKKKAQG